MAYNEILADRVRQVFSNNSGLTERKMFGGLSFLLNGNMCCGVVDDKLVVRVGPEAYESALLETHASRMDFTGKPLRGFVYVEPDGTTSEEALSHWLRRGVQFARSLPAK